MAKTFWTVTAYEIVPVVRRYVAETREEVDIRAGDWVQRQGEERGRVFTGTLRIEKEAERQP